MITAPAFVIFAIVLLKSFDFGTIGISGSAVVPWDTSDNADSVDGNVIRTSNVYGMAPAAYWSQSAFPHTTTTTTGRPAGGIGKPAYRSYYHSHHHGQPYHAEQPKRQYPNSQLQQQERQFHQLNQGQSQPTHWQHQQHQQPHEQMYHLSQKQQPLVPDLYAEFDRRMEQLSNYARDRVDSSSLHSQRQRIHNDNTGGNDDEYDEVEGEDTGIEDAKKTTTNSHNNQADNNDDYAPFEDSADVYARNNRAKRQNDHEDVADDGALRLGKVLNVRRTHHLHDPAQKIHADTAAIASRIKAHANRPHAIERVLVQGTSSRSALPELHLAEQQRRGETLHRQIAAAGAAKRPPTWPGQAVQRMQAHAKAQAQAVSDSFAFREACELCSSQRRATEPQVCCAINDGTGGSGFVAEPRTHKANKRHAGMLAERRRDVGPTSMTGATRNRQPFAMGNNKPNHMPSDSSYAEASKLLNTNGASAFPAVVVKTSPNLSSYKNLMLRSNDDGATVGGSSLIKEMQQQQSSSAPSKIGGDGSSSNSDNAEHSYADFLNYFERQQQQQQQPQQPQQHNNADTDANAALWQGWAHNGLTMRSANETTTKPNATNATSAPNAATTALSTADKPESLPTGTTNRLSSESPSSSSSLLPLQTPANCAKYIDADNSSAALLQRVLDELQRMRAEKSNGNGAETGTPEGAPCNILGSWNSEIIGLRFDISSADAAVADGDSDSMATIAHGANTTTSNADNVRRRDAATTVANTEAPARMASALSSAHDLTVHLFDHSPPKRNPLMDTNWTCSGHTLNAVGGPFTLIAVQSHDKTLATFTGVCKTCGGIETIFGTWNFVRPLRDCRDLQTSLETRRDIFRREMLFVKKQQRLEKMRQQMANGNETSTTSRSVGSEEEKGPTTSTTTKTPNGENTNQRKQIHSAGFRRHVSDYNDDDGEDDVDVFGGGNDDY